MTNSSPANAPAPPVTGTDNPPRWSLDDLYPGPESAPFIQALEKLHRDSEDFARRWRGQLVAGTDSEGGPERILSALQNYERIIDLQSRIGAYAFLHHATQTDDPERTKFLGDVQQHLADSNARLLFFELEINQLGDDAFEALTDSPLLADYHFWLTDLRKGRPHQLSGDLEKLMLEKKLTGVQAWVRLFDQTLSRLRFEVDGRKLTLEPTLNLLQSSKESKRRAAAEALSEVLEGEAPLFTLIANSIIKDRETDSRWRGFSDAADERHLHNQVEGPVVEALSETVRDAYPRLSHRYYALKARWLGKDRLAYWDRNAPPPGEPLPMISWAEARDTVLCAFKAFSPVMAETARAFFDHEWIDALTVPGKAPGAFSHPGAPSAHPFVLLNYQGKPRCVMTLAHELGHGVHQRLAARQGALLAQTSLTLAETASIFGEMLVFEALLARTQSPEARKLLLAQKIEDSLNTVVRQIAFYRFEQAIHAARRDGELTTGDLCRLWLDTQSEALGEAVDLDGGYAHFWAYVPHFIHAPFYVYAYAFGACLVNVLYARYRERPAGFEDNYLALLAAGGSRSYHELLAPFGLDPRAPQFWRGGISVIEGLIDELEAIDA